MTAYLVDTHVLIWSAIHSDRLGTTTRALLADADADVVASAVSIGEMVIKQKLGKLHLPTTPLQIVRDLTLVALALTGTHAQEVANLPPHHGDPFDRWLIAQARVEKRVLISADTAFAKYDVEAIDPRN